jgi:hypothetical protein
MSSDLSGLWRADLERSKLLGLAPKALSAKINHSDPALDVEMLITKADGSEDRLRFGGLTTDEEVTNQVSGAQMRSRLRWVGTELLIESWMKLGGREAHFCDYWSLSGDGLALTMEHRDDDLAGQITLFERAAQEGE